MLRTEQRTTSRKPIGPGIVVAATGVGAGDMVTGLVGGVPCPPALADLPADAAPGSEKTDAARHRLRRTPVALHRSGATAPSATPDSPARAGCPCCSAAGGAKPHRRHLNGTPRRAHRPDGAPHAGGPQHRSDDGPPRRLPFGHGIR
ncbi:hypothetical protein FZ103_03545 [Streptomonospora sp. PA3]|nr:hypothetical protein [Streptomonospora sp. PA3]